MCSYQVKQGNLFGRIGSGIGQGLAEQIPKEIERHRLSEGLKNIGQEEGLSPYQQFAKLAAVPGITPQMLQSGAELLRHQARGKAIGEEGFHKPSPFPEQTVTEKAKTSEVPSLTQESTFAKAQEGFIPRSEPEKMSAAGQKYNQNPAFFGNDPQKAIDYENQIDQTNQSRSQAYQTKHENLSKIQDNVVNRLGSQYEKLQAKVPSELFSRIEDEAIQAAKPKSEGGKGLTEQQAMKEYGNKLNDASRQFEKIPELGNWLITRPAKDTLSAMKGIQNEMEKIGETDNFAKEMITQNQISPELSYSIAQPVNRIPELNKLLKDAPDMNLSKDASLGGLAKRAYRAITGSPTTETLKLAPQLAELVSKNEKASPLAIAHELNKKGLDGQAWLKYLNDNANRLNLRARQSEQANTPLNVINPMNDWWLESFTGIE